MPLRTAFCLLCQFLASATWAATFVVTDNRDNGPGTLREALHLAAANGTATQDLIVFNIPGGTNNWVINLDTELPVVSSNVVIDGSTQPGILVPGSGAKIAISKSTSAPIHGLVIRGADHVEIYGMIFQSFMSAIVNSVVEKKAGIYLENSSYVTIGVPGRENQFVNNGAGIYSSEDPATKIHHIIISSNFIGIDADNTTVIPNGQGIDLSYVQDCVIGGLSAPFGNVVCGNTGNQVGCGGSSGLITISNNFLGVNRGVTKRVISPKGIGVYGSGNSANFLVNDNVICGQETGLFFTNVNAGYRISGNRFGTGYAGTENYGNTVYGIRIFNCDNGGLIGGQGANEGNIITNSDYGIYLERDVAPVTISRNSMYCNLKEPIQFYQTLYTPPLVTITQIDANSVSGTYLPNASIELFYDDDCPNCEGKTWVATVTSNGAGNWTYSGPITGNVIATGTGTDGSTSGFSHPTITSLGQVSPDFCGQRNGSIRNIQVSGVSYYQWLNASGQEVGRSRDLLNVPAGTYRLRTGQPGACIIQLPDFIVPAQTLVYSVSQSTIRPATCGNDNGGVEITGYQSATPTVFSWRNSSGTEVATTQNLDNAAPGTYTLFASNGAGCSGNAGTFTIGRVDAPAIDLSAMIASASCSNREVSATGIRVSGQSAPYTFAWRNEANSVVSVNADLLAVPPGTYTLTVTDKYGCSGTPAAVDLRNVNGAGLKMPNSFSPNGDGVNDTWIIEGADAYPTAKFKLYNRLGDKVFDSTGYSSSFTGNYKGRPLPEGTYYYVIDLKTQCPPLRGSVTILR